MTDFIVVGSGPAGCVLAWRLNRFGYKVTLLEAGGPETEVTKDSPNSRLIATKYFNNFLWTEGNSDDGRFLPFVGGRIEGGGSSVNGMQYVKGSDAFYNLWADITGDNEWNAFNVNRVYPNILKHINIRYGAQNVEAAAAFATSFAEVTNQNVIADYNNVKTPVGGSVFTQLFQYPDGRRCSAYQAFIDPILNNCRSNVEVISNATVTKINFESKSNAKGVTAIVNGNEEVFCARNIILCAGWNSAKILLQSGIGPKNELPKEIYPHLNLPEVGKNIKNQLLFTVYGTGSVPSGEIDLNGLYDGIGFTSDERGRRRFQFIGHVTPDGFSIGLVPLQAQSSGSMSLISDDPIQAPQYSFNYLDNEFDMNEMIEAIGIATDTLIAMGLTPVVENWTPELILAQYNQTFHWVGGCSMDTKEKKGVVTTKGRVHGTHNVYVADSSIIPQQLFSNQPDGNTEGAGALPVGYIVAEQFRRKC